MQRYTSRSNTASAGSIAGSNVAPVQALFQGTIADNFAAGDPVFHDYKTGTAHNFNNMWTALAAVAGPATGGPANDTNPVNVVAQWLADGSFITFSASGTSGSYQLVARRYSPNGITLFQRTILATGAAKPFNMHCALLANGNVALCYQTSTPSTAFIIMTPTLQSVGSGAFTSTTLYHILPVSGGAFIEFGNSGLEMVSAAGAVSIVVALASVSYATQDERNSNQAFGNSPRNITPVDYTPANISSGGFGLVCYNTTTVYYIQLNADGTQRNTTVMVTSQGAQSITLVKYARATGGNITWVQSLGANNGTWGIVSDSGAIVKASAALGSKTGAQACCIGSANGGFVIAYEDGASFWKAHVFDATGTPVAGDPVTISTSTSGAWPGQIYSLSTGVVFIGWPNLYRCAAHRISFTGVVTSFNVFDFGNGNSNQNAAALVLNDTIYGVAATGIAASATAVAYAAFKIDNAGGLVVNTVLGNIQVDVTSPPYGGLRVAVDQSSSFVYVMASSTASTQFTIFDLSLKLLEAYSNSIIGTRVNCINLGYSLAFFDQSNGTSYGGGINIVKPRATIMLGVADKAALAGSTGLVIDTKGMFATSWTAAATFDQSSNNPPGNKGFFANGLCNLTGFI